MQLGLNGKSVVITGGGSNIGRSIVLAFAEEGANITIGDTDTGQAAKVADLALKLGASSVKTIETDVTDRLQVESMFQCAVEQFGTVDVLVNNVGWDQLMYFTQTTPEFWQKSILLNYVSVLNCVKVALDIMIAKKSGAIISVSSDASRQGEPREAVYGGAKAAVNSFMKTIAKENGRFGIRCNTVCPGATLPERKDEVGESSMWFNTDSMFSQDQLKEMSRAVPLRKLGRPRDIANAVVFLASNAAGHVTGQVLSVSGGYSMIG